MIYIQQKQTNDVNIREVVIGYDVNLLILALLSTTLFLLLGKNVFKCFIWIIKSGRIVFPQAFSTPIDEIVESILLGAIDKMPEIDKSTVKTISENLKLLNENELINLSKDLINSDHNVVVNTLKKFI